MNSNDSQLSTSQQVVFIDGNVPDLQDLLNGLAPGVQAFVLDPASDGLQQIADILSANNLTDLSSISLVGHGASGQIDLGSTVVAAGDLSSESAALAQIGAALAPSGTLQLFACDTASGAAGQQFIADLSQFAGGVDVQAATQNIGSTAAGENWTLDASTAPSPAPVSAPFTAQAEADFQGALATPTAQLFFRINGGEDVQLGDINSNGTGLNTIYYGSGAASGGPQNIGVFSGNETSVAVDTAAGLVFSAGIDGPSGGYDSFSVHNLKTGALIETVTLGPGDNNVQALALNPFTDTLYVSDWGDDTGTTGVAVFTYDPSTGLVTASSSGTGSTQVATDINNNSTTATDSGIYLFTGNDVTDYTNANAFFLDTKNSLLYYVNDDTGYNTFPFNSVNSIDVYNIDTQTNTQLTTPAQFPAAGGGVGSIGSNGNLLGIAVDVADGIVFFETTDDIGSAKNALWWVSATGGAGQTAHQITLPSGVTLALAGQTSQGGDAAGLTFDQKTGELYLTNADNSTTTPDTGAIYVLQWNNTTQSFSLVTSYDTATLVGTSASNVNPEDAPSTTSIDDLPVLTTSGTSTHAAEQGANVILLTATPTITDADGNHLASATVQITSGTFSSNENSTADDHLTVGGAASGTSGAISWSYNSGTETLTLSGYDTLADYASVLAQVQYNTTGDNPTNYGNNTSRTITFQANDGAVGNPSGTNTTTTTLNIDAVDDAPVNHLPATPSINEDVLTTISGLSITDVDADPANQNIQVTLSVSHGTLTLNTAVAGGITSGEITAGASGSNTITITATQNQINTTLGNATGLQYQGNLNFNTGFGAENLHIVTSDLNHTGSGGPLTTTNDLGITVNAVNDPPNLQPDTTTGVSYTENASATALFAGEKIDSPIADPDQSANYAGGSVDLQITANAVAGDRISLMGSTFHISGGNIQDSGNNNIGTISGNGTSHVTISALTTAATPTVVDQLVQSFGFDSTSDDPTAATRTVTLTFNDGGNTGSGSALTDNVTQTVAVTAVNDPPVNHVPGTQIFNEDTSRIFNTANGDLISITDPDAESGNETVTLSVNHGTLTLGSIAGLSFTTGDGTTDANMAFSGTLAAVNTALNGLTYAPASNFNGSDTLSITTNDNGNTPGPAAQDVDTVTLAVSAVNDAPVVVNGTSVSLVAIDEDSANPAGVPINSLLSNHFSDAADDQTANGGSAANNFAGIAVTLDVATAGQGVWQYSTDSGAHWTAFPSVTTGSALLIAATDEIRFLPAANFNGTPGSLTIHLVDDSAGAISTGGTANLGTTGSSTPYSSGTISIGESVNAVNDAPTFTGLGGTASFTEGTGLGVTGTAVALDATATVHDVELDALNGGNGNYAGATLTLARDGGASADDQFNFSTGTVTVNGNTLQSGGQPFATFTNTGGTLTIDFTSSGTIATTALVDNVLDHITYANTSDAPPASVQVDYTFNDGNSGSQGSGGALTGTGNVIVNITPTNDAPDVTPNSPTAVTYIEGQASPVGLLSTGAVTDPDLPANFAGGDLTVAIGTGDDVGNDEIVLLSSSGFIDDAGTLMDSATAIGTDSGLGTDTVTITSLTAAATPAEVSKLLEAFAFQTTSTTAGDRTVGFTFHDGGNTGGTPPGLLDSVSQTVHVTAPAAGAPTLVVTATGTDPVEQVAPVSVASGAAITTAADPGGTIASATVVVSGSFGGSGDQLSVLDGATNITTGKITGTAISVAVTTDADGNETLTLTGVDSEANYQSALDNIQFFANADNPTDFGLHPTRTLTWSVNDGPSDSVPVSTSITIDAVNDAPVNTVPGAQSVAEDTALAFTGGNTISASDADNRSLSVTLSANHGNVTLGSVTNLTVTGTNGSHSVTIAGLTADVDAALATLSYQGDANFNSLNPDTLTISTSDGIAAPTVSTVDITVTPVADAPSGADHGASTNVNTPYVFAASDFGFSDAADDQTGVGGSSPNNFTGVKITTLSLPSGATLKDNSTTVNASDTILISDINGGKLVFTPATGAGGSNYANFTFQVQDDGSNTPPNANLDPTPNLMTLNVGSGFGPTAAADSYNVLENATASGTAGTGGTGVLHNDSGSGLTVTAVDGLAGNVGASTQGTYGELTLNDNGNFSYVADQTGAIDGVSSVAHPVDTFNYTVTDNEATPLSATTTVSFSIDRDPATATHNVSVLENASTGTVSAGDTDPDGDSLTVTGLTGGTVGAPDAETYGTLTLNINDTYTYTASNTANINGAAPGSHPTDTFTYTVDDGLGGTALETLNFAVDRAPPAPVDNDPANDSAGPINGSIAEGATAGTTVGITASSTDADGDTVSYSLTNDTSGGGFTINAATGVVLVADPSKIDFESTSPNHSYSITVQADDGHGGTSSQAFTIAVTDVAPSAPVDADTADNDTVVEGALVGTAVGIQASSTDVNGGTVSYSLTNDTSGGGFTINAASGVVTVADPSKIDFETTAPNHTYTITVQVKDGTLPSTQNFTIAVTDANPSVPGDNDGTANGVTEGAAVGTHVGITASSSDVNGPPVTYSLTDSAGGFFTIDPTSGVVSVDTAGATGINYETAPGHAYSITVQASDSQGGVSTVSFSIPVTDVAPTSVADSYTVDEDTLLNPNAAAGVIANDTDINGGPLTAVLDTGPTHDSTFTLNADGSFSYQGALNFNGSDSFTYHAFDGAQSGGTVTVNLTINPVNDPPILTGFGDTSSFTENGSSVVLDVDGNTAVSDVELDAAGNYAGATLTIARQGGANSDDSFVATGSLDVVDVGVDGNVSLDGGSTFIGTFIDNGDGSVTFTFNSNATAADVDSVMRQIAYADTSDNPPATVNVDFTFSDGNGVPGGQNQGGGASPGIAVGTFTVDVTQVDDPPALLNVAVAASYPIGSSGVDLSSGLQAFDPDAAPPSPIALAGANITITSGFLASDELFVNLPTDGSGHFITPDTGVTDIVVQSNSGGQLVLTGSGEPSQPALNVLAYREVLEAVSYRSSSADPTNGGTDPTRIISWQLSDGVLDNEAPVPPNPPGTYPETTLGFNQPPSIDLDGSAGGTGYVTTYTENGAPLAIVASSVSITDPDDAAISQATIVLTDAKADDALFIAGSLPVGIDSSIGTSVAGQITLTLFGSAALADYQTALQQIQFVNTSENPDPTVRDITVQVSNTGSSNVAHATVHVISVNDAPVATITPTGYSVIEKTSLSLKNAGLSVSDVDDGGGIETVTLSVGEGTLTVAAGTSGAVIDSGNGSGSVMFHGTIAQLDDLLNTNATSAITYIDDTDTPGPATTLTLAINDGGNTGTGGARTGQASATITIDQPPHVSPSNVDEWILTDGEWVASGQPGSIPSGYQVAGTGAFTGNGTSDILWQNPTSGDTQEWLIDNGAWAGTVDLGVHPGNYQIAGIGDFFGNGIDDVLWTSSSGGQVQTDIWELNSNGQWQASVSPGSHPSGYNVVGVGDFTGNGTSDILWQNLTTGDVDEWQIANGQWTNSVDLGSHPGSGWTIAGVGDFFGNGRDDILWTNPNSGPGGDTEVDIWQLGSNGQWTASVSPGLGLHPPGYQVTAIGNFTGNGTDGVLWYDPTSGNVDEWVLDTNGQWVTSINLGSHPGNFQIAGTGAFVNGNSTSDILWHQNS